MEYVLNSKKILTFSLVAMLVLFSVLPIQSEAASFPYDFSQPLISCTGDGKDMSIGSGSNVTVIAGKKCQSICDILATIQNIIYFGMTLLVFVIAPLLIVWGGILVITAGASPENMSKGKSVVTGTLIGMAIALGAFMIINTALGFLASSAGGASSFVTNWSSINCQISQ